MTSADSVVKIIVAGGLSTGKTSLLKRYVDGTFPATYVPTVGVEFKRKKLQRTDKEVILQLWDTSGSEKYKPLTVSYFRGTKAFVIVFDLTSQESFDLVDSWVLDIKKVTGYNAVSVLVGNKSDLTDTRAISLEQCSEKAQHLNLHKYFEVTAKENINVDKIFEYIVGELMLPAQAPRMEESRVSESPVEIEEKMADMELESIAGLSVEATVQSPEGKTNMAAMQGTKPSTVQETHSAAMQDTEQTTAARSGSSKPKLFSCCKVC